jgi:hypothetical protein
MAPVRSGDDGVTRPIAKPPPMPALAELKANQARIWGSASWQHFERHRTPEGINAPRPYLLILGRRRTG